MQADADMWRGSAPRKVCRNEVQERHELHDLEVRAWAEFIDERKLQQGIVWPRSSENGGEDVTPPNQPHVVA